MLFQQIQLYEDFARSRAKKGVEDTIHDVEKDTKPKAPATTHIFQVRRNILIYKIILFKAMGMKVLDLHPPPACSETSRLKSSLFFKNLINSFSTRKMHVSDYQKPFKGIIMQFLQHTCTTANKFRSLHIVHWKLME